MLIATFLFNFIFISCYNEYQYTIHEDFTAFLPNKAEVSNKMELFRMQSAYSLFGTEIYSKIGTC